MQGDHAELLTRLTQLQAAVGHHKSAIRRHRQQLQQDKAALVSLEAECRRRGIGFRTVTTSSGEGDIHGHPAGLAPARARV